MFKGNVHNNPQLETRLWDFPRPAFPLKNARWKNQQLARQTAGTNGLFRDFQKLRFHIKSLALHPMFPQCPSLYCFTTIGGNYSDATWCCKNATWEGERRCSLAPECFRAASPRPSQPFSPTLLLDPGRPSLPGRSLGGLVVAGERWQGGYSQTEAQGCSWWGIRLGLLSPSSQFLIKLRVTFDLNI